MVCTVIVGGFFGSEGKGKIVGYLSLKDNLSIAVRGGSEPMRGIPSSQKGGSTA